MCGIAGYIGRSEMFWETETLATSLFAKLESRGLDASGVWGTEMYSANSHTASRVIYHKEPVRSSQFVKSDFWKSIFDSIEADLLLMHARYTSSNGGPAHINSNNHPFVSMDKKIGMIHNGALTEVPILKQYYDIRSQTDSEYLLRIYEHALGKRFDPIEDVDDKIVQRVSAAKEIWRYIQSGAMAVAIGERIDDIRRGLLLFRNEHRPLWLIDLRATLGQIFFFSSPEIWFDAIAPRFGLKKPTIFESKGLCYGDEQLIEIPPNQIWYIATNGYGIIDQILKFSVETTPGSNNPTVNKLPVKESEQSVSVVTQLNEKEEIESPPLEELARLNAMFEEIEDGLSEVHRSIPVPPRITGDKLLEVIDLLNRFKQELDEIISSDLYSKATWMTKTSSR